MIIKLSARERATILAALRRWSSFPAAREADSIATNGGKHEPLDNGEIERLCKRITKINRKRDGGALLHQLNNGDGGGAGQHRTRGRREHNGASARQYLAAGSLHGPQLRRARIC